MLTRVLSLLLAVGLWSPISAEARQLSNLISDTRLLVRDTGTTRQRFTDTNITDFLNEGQRQMVSRSWCTRKSFSFQLSPGSTYYSLPSNFMAVTRVTRGGLALTELSPAALDGRSRGWEASSGLPTYYYVNFSSRGFMGFAPWPATASDTDTIKVEYIANVADMSASTDSPFDNLSELRDYQHALPYFAAARMAAIDGKLPLAQSYLTFFEMVEKTMEDKCLQMPNYLPSAIGKP